MKRLLSFHHVTLCVCLVSLIYPSILQAQTAQNPPPVGAPLVREGDFAVTLQQALGVGTSDDEIEAETRLGELGIGPSNGWIADYPVTPDIVGEIQNSVANAADAGQLKMSRDEALGRLNTTSAEMGLPIAPYAVGTTYQNPPVTESYPNPGAVNNYYYTEGPPVVTYYTPPPDYYPLYTWVTYPFFAGGFFFNGFFVLNDFHRHVFVHGRHGHPAFVSNHFRDMRDHRVFRVDPGHRFEGRTFAGIGAPPRRGFIATGVPRSGRTVFNSPVNRFGPRMAGPGFGHESRMGGGFGGRGGGFGGHGGFGHGGGMHG